MVLVSQVSCDVGQFICPVYKNTTNARICVNQKHICDGQFDCHRGEDEAVENCPKASFYHNLQKFFFDFGRENLIAFHSPGKKMREKLKMRTIVCNDS